ncbi:MAG: hypothetical protein M1825_006149 [Sarcosagium campestre]|nr:MAG: hypothetical protein M1825_006149 [Sarcosagium campestre]
MLPLRRFQFALAFCFLTLLIWLYHVGSYTPAIRTLCGQNSDQGEGMLKQTGQSFKNIAFSPGIIKPPGSNYTRTLVAGHRKDDDISWMSRLPDIKLALYNVDDLSAPLHPPKNKGREAMVYLTYIIDHYDRLPDTVLFFHAHESAWHNNVLLDLSSSTTIKRLRSERVQRVGYFPSRCHLDPGCPNWLHLDRPEGDLDTVKKPEEVLFTPKIWRELHPLDPIPPALSQPCCAQFAVSGDRIRANPRSRYEHYRNWLLKTDLPDDTSGRVMEYLWQYIFTGNAEFCPITHSCYCLGYGVCFGSEAKLDAWLATLKEREQADEDLRIYNDARAENAAATDDAKEKRLRERVESLRKDLDERKAEAYARGDAAENRLAEAERE